MKQAIIIGASSGIGRAMAVALAKRNYRVFITARSICKLREMQNEFPKLLCPYEMDVTDHGQSEIVLQSILKESVTIDLFVYCAGVGEQNPSFDFRLDEPTMLTNVFGFHILSNSVFRHCLEQGFGHMVNLSSIAGLRGGRNSVAYNASKAYQMNYLEGLRLSIPNHIKDVHITDIRPGFIDTPMAKGEGLFWVAPIDKAVCQILTAVDKKRKVVYVTKRWSMVATLLKVIPISVLSKLSQPRS